MVIVCSLLQILNGDSMLAITDIKGNTYCYQCSVQSKLPAEECKDISQMEAKPCPIKYPYCQVRYLSPSPRSGSGGEWWGIITSFNSIGLR